MSHYPHMLKPCMVNTTQLKNRVVMGSMHTGLEDRLWHRKKLAAYFAERARGGVGLIITGGFNPNRRGWFYPFSGAMLNHFDAWTHRPVTKAVHQAEGKICLQLLHAGRYSYHPFSQSASSIKSPINPFKPKAMTTKQVKKTILSFAKAAKLAQKAGYDGVEIMGSEGYLINQFTASRTNQRTDEFGGSSANRQRFPVEILKAVRQACGQNFLIIFRLSMIDLVPDGATKQEIIALAKALEAAGADMLNTGIGWHESRVPTIVTSVPRGAFAQATAQVKAEVSIPVIASNRINTPEIAEEIIQAGQADFVSMARPMLADPQFVNKAAQGRRDEINICIACNQACLDHTFELKRASCLVNPQACRETELLYIKTQQPKKIAVVGAGPAGLSCATVAAQRGHQVTLFDASDRIGGQFNMAARIPGKEEFWETIAYYNKQITQLGIELKLNTPMQAESLAQQGFDEVVVATGVTPRMPGITGVDHPKVVSYVDVLRGHAEVGNSVAIIGAGGIGFDVAEFLLEHTAKQLEPLPAQTSTQAQALPLWLAEWGVDFSSEQAGGLSAAVVETPTRKLFLLQRKTSEVGKHLGKTSGWVHRAVLRKKSVQMLNGCEYTKIDDQGLHIIKDQQAQCLAVDTVVICAGQESQRSLYDTLRINENQSKHTHLIGGAQLAAELDAKRAIRQGAELAAGF